MYTLVRKCAVHFVRILCLLVLWIALLSRQASAQSTVQVSGVVKAQGGVIQQAEVEFYTLNDDFQGNSVTCTNGRFKSDNKMAVGRKIRVRVMAGTYKTLQKDITVPANGDLGEFRLERSALVISGFVRDSVSGAALPAVEIAFYDEKGKLIKAKFNTDSRGYFDLETDFVFGQKITVRFFKKGYYDDKEYSQTFSRDGRTSLPDILLPELGARGLRAFIRIRNRSTDKALGGANVHFFDVKKSRYFDSIVPSSGDLELKLYQRPGTLLDMKITRPNYFDITANENLSEDPQRNQFSYQMEKLTHSHLAPILLIGTGAAALTGGGMYYASTKQYNKYKDFANAKRENDLKGAELKRTISAAAGGVAAAALVGYIITRMHEKKVEKQLERSRPQRTGFVPLAPEKGSAGIASIGIAYSF